MNLCLQHLNEAQLVLCSYCEAVHLGIDVLQELVSGMNLLANFIIYPYLIPNDIPDVSRETREEGQLLRIYSSPMYHSTLPGFQITCYAAYSVRDPSY
jgi:hypothetical protein